MTKKTDIHTTSAAVPQIRSLGERSLEAVVYSSASRFQFEAAEEALNRAHVEYTVTRFDPSDASTIAVASDAQEFALAIIDDALSIRQVERDAGIGRLLIAIAPFSVLKLLEHFSPELALGQFSHLVIFAGIVVAGLLPQHYHCPRESCSTKLKNQETTCPACHQRIFYKNDESGEG